MNGTAGLYIVFVGKLMPTFHACYGGVHQNVLHIYPPHGALQYNRYVHICIEDAFLAESRAPAACDYLIDFLHPKCSGSAWPANNAIVFISAPMHWPTAACDFS